MTVQIYAGIPLTTIARWCGTSVAMLDKHYAGVIATWDGVRVPADEQIRRAREQLTAVEARRLTVTFRDAVTGKALEPYAGRCAKLTTRTEFDHCRRALEVELARIDQAALRVPVAFAMWDAIVNDEPPTVETLERRASARQPTRRSGPY